MTSREILGGINLSTIYTKSAGRFSYVQLSAHFTVELMIVVAYAGSTIIISDFEIVARNSVATSG